MSKMKATEARAGKAKRAAPQQRHFVFVASDGASKLTIDAPLGSRVTIWFQDGGPVKHAVFSRADARAIGAALLAAAGGSKP